MTSPRTNLRLEQRAELNNSNLKPLNNYIEAVAKTKSHNRGQTQELRSSYDFAKVRNE